MGYDPTQPREPKGSPDGGQWARGSGSGAMGGAGGELTGDQAAAVKQYTTGGYKTINPKLREGQPLTAGEQFTVDQLDTAIAAHSRPIEGPLFRGEPLLKNPLSPQRSLEMARRSGSERDALMNEYTFDTVQTKFPVGSTFTDRAFVSTSRDTQPALDASLEREHYGVFFRIHGARGLDVGATTHSAYDDEAEVLLPRNSRFQVRSVQWDQIYSFNADADRPRIVVDVEMIG